MIFLKRASVAKYTGACKKSGCNSNHTVLHYLCQFRPPLSVVKSIYKSHSKAIFQKDCKGRYPLHIACKHGCTPDVVNYLLEKYPQAARECDLKQRSPLILAYRSYVFECGLAFCFANRNLTEVGQALISAAPDMVTAEDNKGQTALEYAIAEQFKYPTIEILQLAASSYHGTARDQSKRIHQNQSTITAPIS